LGDISKQKKQEKRYELIDSFIHLLNQVGWHIPKHARRL